MLLVKYGTVGGAHERIGDFSEGRSPGAMCCLNNPADVLGHNR